MQVEGEKVIASAAELPWPPQPPSYFIKTDILDPFSMSYDEFAKRIDVPFDEVVGIMDQGRNLTFEMVQRLSELTGQSVEYWHNLQIQHDLWFLIHQPKTFGIRPLHG